MSNKAAWLSAAKTRPFKVDDAPMPSPEAHEIVIRNHAVATNPADWLMQELDVLIDAYPTVLGCDVAGEIAAVGSAVKDFKTGDRVIALVDSFLTKRITNAGFQLYCATTEKLVAKLPGNISYGDGVVLPLGLSTAADGLFNKDGLALPHPQANPEPTGKVLLVWGGSSSVGSCAIQLAKAAGFEVATAASSRNQDYARSLGAKYVFDHAKDGVVEDAVRALKGQDFAGVYDAISTLETLTKSAQIASQLGGNSLVCTVVPPGRPLPDGVPGDVEYGHVNSLGIIDNEVGGAVWGKWVPAALADGSLKCKPDPLVVGQGLEMIQVACDKHKEGASARKVVVELP